jgi:hypothetical protein
VVPPKSQEIGVAINDRLLKASYINKSE